MKVLKPTKRKIIISLIPFMPVVFMSIFLIEIPFSFPMASVFMIIQLIIVIVAYGSIILMALPLQSVLASLGMWEYNSSLFIVANGPEVSVSGMILTASFYFVIIYLLLSFISYRRRKKEQLLK